MHFKQSQRPRVLPWQAINVSRPTSCSLVKHTMDLIHGRPSGRLAVTMTESRRLALQKNLHLVEAKGFNRSILWPWADNPTGIPDSDRRRIERALGLPYLYCGSCPDKPLEERLADVQVLRILRCKPSKIDDVRKLRELRQDAEYVLQNCRSQKADAIADLKAYVSESKQARLKLLIEDIKERISVLESITAEEDRADRRAQAAAASFASTAKDSQLAGALWQALDATPPTVGYVYLKRWRMPDGSCWFKLGITNNPGRRDIEQNVLPVAAETIACVDVGSMDRAKAIEFVIHQVLDEQRITDANNRELFHLSDPQVSAVKAVLERLV